MKKDRARQASSFPRGASGRVLFPPEGDWKPIGPLFLGLVLLINSVGVQGCRKGRPGESREEALAAETDALGVEVLVHEYPGRIVSTAPSNTEILLSLGLEEKLVGITSFHGASECLDGVATVGGYINPDVSKIISLHPDIVFAARGNSKDAIQQLRQHGTKVFTLDTKTVSELLTDIGKVGALSGAGERAKRLVDSIRREILDIEEAVGELSHEEKPTVFWISQEEPLRTAGPGTLVDELIGLAGGSNVARDEEVPWPAYSVEKLVLRDPQVILLSEDKYRDSPNRVAETTAGFKRHPVWGGISAVRQGRVYYIPAEFLGQPSPAFVTGLKMLAGYLHPDSFAAIPPIDSQATGKDGRD